jgi:hypothetical protein
MHESGDVVPEPLEQLSYQQLGPGPARRLGLTGYKAQP